MSEETIISGWSSNEYCLSAINIPSISSAMNMLNSELSNASLVFLKIQTASTTLEQAIRSASLVTSRHEIADSLQISSKAFSGAMAEMENKMTLLQEILSKNTVIPATLLTADDISVAIHVAVNSPKINYRLAEMSLHRFLHLWYEEWKLTEWKKGWTYGFLCKLPKAVWTYDFLGDIVKVFKGDDDRENFNFLRLIKDLTDNEAYLECSAELFDTLSLVLCQRKPSIVVENDRRDWVYLLSKNRQPNVDHGILRLINSFLYSSRNETISDVLQIIAHFTSPEFSPKENMISLVQAPNIPKALYQILIEKTEDKDLLELSLGIMHDAMIALGDFELNMFDEKEAFVNTFVDFGICDLLINIIETYSIAENYAYDRHATKKYSFKHNTNENIIQLACYIIDEMTSYYSFGEYSHEYILKFIAGGMVNCLVKFYNSPFYEGWLARTVRGIVKSLCVFDLTFIQQFDVLGISRDSNFFWDLPENLI